MIRIRNNIRESEHGATLIEAAIALPLFVFLLLATFELLRVAYYSLSLQFVATNAMRSATIEDPTDIRTSITGALRPLAITLKPDDTVTFCPVDLYSSKACPADTEVQIAGEKRELMILSVRMTLTGFLVPWFDSLQLTLSSDVIGRNEPWQ